MNVVYLSPHFPPNYHRFCLELKHAGANVLGIGDAAYEQLSPEVRGALTEYYRIDDLHDYDALVRACGFFTHRYGKIHRFESLNEYWLETEARIRDDFNLYGIRSREIVDIRRKSRMKEIFRAAGVAVARGRVVRTIAEARELIRETGYPVVVKPDAGVGATNTFRLENDENLSNFFHNKPAVDYIMEEFITGTIYSFDGLVDQAGQLVFYTSHLFNQGIMEIVNRSEHMYYYSLREIPPVLEALGRACARAFGLRERFFHIEFFKTESDAFVGLEVNIRPPGGFTTDMFNYACDMDIYRTWGQLLVEGRTNCDFRRKYHCCYASRKNNRDYRFGHDEIMNRYGAAIVQVDRVPGVFSGALGDIGYIFRSPDLQEILSIVAAIHAA